MALLALVPFVNIVMVFVLGARGSRWAWRNRHWRDAEHFRRTQRKWAIAGLLVWIVFFGAAANGEVTVNWDGTGEARLDIPIEGENGTGSAISHAVRNGGVWDMRLLVVTVNGSDAPIVLVNKDNVPVPKSSHRDMKAANLVRQLASLNRTSPLFRKHVLSNSFRSNGLGNRTSPVSGNGFFDGSYDRSIWEMKTMINPRSRANVFSV
jgi:hypothetical protein